MTRLRRIAATAVVLSLALPFSARAERELPPEGGEPKNFSLPEAHTFSMINGLRATLVPFGNVPKVSVGVMVRTGNVDEKTEEIWLADIVGDMLTEGTIRRTSSEIARDISDMGSEVRVRVGADRLSISTDVLSEYGLDAMRLLAEILTTPSFPEGELERIKADNLRSLSVARTRAQSLANERLSEVLYGDHRYGTTYPTKELLQGYTIDQVRAFHSKHFGAARTHVYVVGDFDTKRMEMMIRAVFLSFAMGPPPSEQIPNTSSERVLHLIDRPDAPQSTIRIAISVADPSHADFIPLEVTNTLLGGSFSSRIIQNVREDKGYSYSPYSSIRTHYHDAYWVESADVTTEHTGATIGEIFFEIDRLRNEAPSEEELSSVQSYMSGSFVLSNSSRWGIMGQLIYADFQGLGDDFLTSYVENIHAVSADQVRDMARRYLHDENMAIVVVGDTALVRAQIEPFGKIVN